MAKTDTEAWNQMLNFRRADGLPGAFEACYLSMQAERERLRPLLLQAVVAVASYQSLREELWGPEAKSRETEEVLAALRAELG